MSTHEPAGGAPTQAWRSHAALPGLSGPADTAERLLLLVHYGVDWDSWIGARRATYWETLVPDRIIAATYRTNSLMAWWTTLHATLETAPRGKAERAELASLLGEPAGPVLRVLRTETDALVLRCRIISDAVRQARTAQTVA